MTKKITRTFSLFFIFALLLTLLPLNIFAAGSTNPPPSLTSSAYILVDAQTGQILYGKDETTQMFPASTTKLVTAILAAEYYEQNPEATVTVKKETIDDIPSAATSIDIEADETLTLKDLMYATLLPSANDAAAAIAQLIDGDEWRTTFPQKMNQKAKEIGAVGTNFTNPHGLHDDNHYSTAKDISLILAYALNNKTVKEILGTVTYEIPATDKSSARELKTSNELIKPRDTNYNPNAIGGKTGTTDEAGCCLAAAAQKGGNTLIAVVLKNEDDQQRFIETNKLLNYGFENFTKTEIPSDMIPRKMVGIVSEDKLMGTASVYAESSSYVWLHNSLTVADNISIDANPPETFAYTEDGNYTAEATVTLKEPSRYMKSDLGKISLKVSSALYDNPKANTVGSEGETENKKENSGSAFKIIMIVFVVILLLALGVMIGCYVYINIKRKNAVKNRKFARLEGRSLNPEDQKNEMQIDDFGDLDNTIVRPTVSDKKNETGDTKVFAVETELRKIEKERIDKKIAKLREKGILPEDFQDFVIDQDKVNDDLNDTKILSEDIKEALKSREEQRKNQENDF